MLHEFAFVSEYNIFFASNMQDKLRVLLADSDPDFLQTMGERIRGRGMEPVLAESGVRALEKADYTHLDLAIVELRISDMDGIALISRLREKRPGLQTVLLTGYGEEETRQACEDMQSRYFEKHNMAPFWKFIHRFSLRSNVVVSAPQECAENMEAKDKTEFEQVSSSAEDMQSWGAGPASSGSRPRIIGETPAIQEVKNSISKVASLDCTVLISGETGTGKELVARSIHLNSFRSRGKFLAINCSAFGQDLLNNELFGYERETNSGNIRVKKGIFEAAQGGTILLDEICETPQMMQTHLLRVLEDKLIIRSGSTEEIPVDVRVLAATNQRLSKKMESGQFRRDLYYRLNTFVLRMPSLRERKEDIPLLANYFLGKYRKEYGKKIERISDEVMQMLMKYSFPGNVRDLEHALERAIIVCDGRVILPEHLPRRFSGEGPAIIEDEEKELVTLAEMEKEHIRKVLHHTRGNRNEAARILGISRTSLWRKLKEDREFG